MRFREILENAWDWSKEEMEDMIRTSAKKNGIDPDIAVRVWKSEGGMNKQSNVDRDGKGSYNGKEDSWGPFQMYLGGGMGNAYVKKYHDGDPDGLRGESSKEEVQRQIDFALNQATLPYLVKLANNGYQKTLSEDKNFLAGLNVHKGYVTYKAVADAFGHEFVEPLSILR